MYVCVCKCVCVCMYVCLSLTQYKVSFMIVESIYCHIPNTRLCLAHGLNKYLPNDE